MSEHLSVSVIIWLQTLFTMGMARLDSDQQLQFQVWWLVHLLVYHFIKSLNCLLIKIDVGMYVSWEEI